MESKKTNLFVVGAMRSGTTSFMEVLANHPKVYISPVKEPHYFVTHLPKQVYSPSRFFSTEAYFEKEFPAPLHIAHILKKEHYNKLFSLATDETYRCEASTCYLHDKEAATAIASYNPEAKIIIITRSPLERAYSHYKMDKGLGRITISFEEALRKELQAYKLETLPWYSYLNMSCYSKAIQRFERLFENVLVLSYEELYHGEPNWDSLWTFLGLPSFALSEIPHKNESREIKGQKLYAKLQDTIWKDYFSKFVGTSLKKALFKSISSDDNSQFLLSDELLLQVEDFFIKED